MVVSAAKPGNDMVLADDLGNIVELEHVNITVPDQITATWFYIVGLGFTRDPYMNVSPLNMWVNIGEQEFHLPTRGPQVIPGHIGLVVPDLAELQQRLKSVEPHLAGTAFSWSAQKGYLEITCPWGNQFRAYAPQAQFGTMKIGVPYVELLVKPGTAAGIARFYEQVLEASTTVKRDKAGAVAHVKVGSGQELRFRESADAPDDYAGHHVAVYVANVSPGYAFFQERGLVMEEMRNHQYRFMEIVDPETGEPLTKLEHEVRTLRHPMFGRPFVNRNPEQSQMGYRRGEDAYLAAM